MKNFCLLAVVMLLVAANDPKDDAGKKELAKLQGTWSYVSFVNPNGDKMPDDQLKKMSITYSGDKWTVKEEDRVIVSGTQKLDPSRRPHEIDAVITEGEGKGNSMLGIYEWEGDMLKVCFDPMGKERPTSLTPKMGQFGGVIKRRQ
jgi:uncharacterized protein (TIGR03067 family)